MIKSWHSILSVFACALGLCTSAQAQTFVKKVGQDVIFNRENVPDSLLTRIGYPHGVSKLQNYPKLNIAALEYFQMMENPDIELFKVYVIGSTSPVGLWGDNVQLCKNRVENVSRYIMESMDIPSEKIEKVYLNEDWDRLYSLIESSDIPYRDKALDIMLHKSWGERKTALRNLAGGRVWEIATREFFPELRSVRFAILFKDKPKPAPVVKDTVYVRDTIYIREYIREVKPEPEKVLPKAEPEQAAPVAHQPKYEVVDGEPVITISHSYVPSHEKASKTPKSGYPWHFGIKTNLASDVMVIPELALEFQLGKHTSLNLAGWYTPFNIVVPKDKTTNVYGFRPQFRLWFGENCMKQGSYLALDGAVMWYTLQWKDGLLYQNGKEGTLGTGNGNKNPAWSAGFSYGYCVGLGKKKAWGLEFELGIGYTRCDSNVGDTPYLNEDGMMVSNPLEFRPKQVFGVTHANINLTYRISSGKKNKK